MGSAGYIAARRACGLAFGPAWPGGGNGFPAGVVGAPPAWYSALQGSLNQIRSRQNWSQDCESGHHIYINPLVVANMGSYSQLMMMAHELLYNIAGLVDDEIQAALGFEAIGG